MARRRRCYPRIVMTIAIRKKDGATFKPSFPRPEEYAEHGGPMDSLFDGSSGFFFRRIERRGWWIFKVWRETGEIWKPESGEFDVSKS